MPPEIILNPHDIILSRILPDLCFDQYDGDLALVFESVDLSHLDVGRFVGTDELDFVSYGDSGGAADDDPVFVAVEVLLQAEAFAGFDDDALDLVVGMIEQHFVGTPRAVGEGVDVGQFALVCFELFDDLLDLLAGAFFADEEGVGCIDDDQILDVDRGDLLVV